MVGQQKFVVVGAGPVGSLAALYAAKRGHDVEIYELRSDLRDPSTIPLNFTKSINLALSERGINAMSHAGSEKLLHHVKSATIPMEGRMIHGKRPSGDLYEEPQLYDIHGRGLGAISLTASQTIFAVDRADLNKRLLDILENMPNVKFFFNHKLTGADFKNRKAWFEARGPKGSSGRAEEIEIDFDFMIGADGAHSAVRYHLMKYVRMDYQQTYIDTNWCEFTIQPDSAVAGGLKSNIPKFGPADADFQDGSFTCTLFMPSGNFAELEADSSKLPDFFDYHFPGVTSLIPRSELISSFEANPHLPLISIKCTPYHFSSSAVVLGDAAHAMVPFYGQGMNAGLEDVYTLFSILDKHSAQETNDPEGRCATDPDIQRASALAEYTEVRTPDAHAINDLALQNYIEMRASVLSPTYRLRKALEELLSKYIPRLGWQTKYSRVSFSNERFSEVIAKSDHQGKVLTRVLQLLLFGTLAGGVVGLRYLQSPSTPNFARFIGSLRDLTRG
ncbi:kynurenine 3-monooxygenase, mitochondrial precursor [Pestalotiopsis sp. 9143b]|nr:kynurenine 3-monooxygenase, mitochondrial precursor [Pestalotiopsis sp. 9143b]